MGALHKRKQIANIRISKEKVRTNHRFAALQKEKNVGVLMKKKITGEKRSLLEIIDFKFLIRVVLALTIDTLLVNVLLGTYWCSIMYGKGFMFYLTMRFTKNLIQLPINIFLTYNVIGIVKVINNKIYKNE